MKVKIYIEQREVRKRKVRNKEDEDDFTKYFWDTVRGVQSGVYEVKHFDSLVEEAEKNRNNKTFL